MIVYSELVFVLWSLCVSVKSVYFIFLQFLIVLFLSHSLWDPDGSERRAIGWEAGKADPLGDGQMLEQEHSSRRADRPAGGSAAVTPPWCHLELWVYLQTLMTFDPEG